METTTGSLVLTLLWPFVAGILICAAAGWWWVRHRERVLTRALEAERELIRREGEMALREGRSALALDLDRRRHDLESEMARRRSHLETDEERLKVQRGQLEEDRKVLEQARVELEQEASARRAASEEAKRLATEYRMRMQALSGLDPEVLRSELTEAVRRDCEEELRVLKAQLLNRGEASVREDAMRVLVDSMQRLATTPMHDVTATIVPIPNEAMKGRIIGREGRNIKSFESATGTTLLIDETPDSVLISSFDPVRREVARVALLRLVKDGRIHPTSIEEAVREAGEQIRQSVIEFGEDAVRKTRVAHLHPEVMILLGKLRFRLSNNQNSLDHSIEVANLCSLMAAELGLDSEVARRAGLLHDIGKSIEGDYDGSHANSGAEVLKRLGEDLRVVNAVAAHHEEVPAESAYATLVMIADSLSAARPGARSESVDSYLQRVRSLENLAKEIPGVLEAYAVQAGREIRVIVAPEVLGDEAARVLARDLRRRIEDELHYPGSIRVTVIREQRFTESAR